MAPTPSSVYPATVQAMDMSRRPRTHFSFVYTGVTVPLCRQSRCPTAPVCSPAVQGAWCMRGTSWQVRDDSHAACATAYRLTAVISGREEGAREVQRCDGAVTALCVHEFVCYAGLEDGTIVAFDERVAPSEADSSTAPHMPGKLWFFGHRKAVHAIAMCPSGRLASSAADGELRHRCRG